jgi:hypothetical protein
MTTGTKIYRVQISARPLGRDDSADGYTVRLIRSQTRAGAVRAAVAGHVTSRLATQDDIVAAMAAGIPIEDAAKGDEAEHDKV